MLSIAKAGIWADCVRERKPIIVNDYQHAPNKKGYPEGHFPVKNFLSFPIFDDDKIVMVCGVGNKEADYTQHDVDELSVFMSSAWLVMKEFQADEQLKERVKDIEKQNNLMLGREMKMVELKQEVNSLLSELKRPEKYLRH